MKLLSVAIPSYNSAEYMRRAIESLLPGGEDLEILIVDDVMVRRMIPERLRTSMRSSILTVFGRFIRRIRGMAARSIPDLRMRRDCILKWSTAMTG